MTAAEVLKKLGAAHLVLATAPHSEAIAGTVGGLTSRGKLLIVAAPFEPMQVSAVGLSSGKSIAAWPGGKRHRLGGHPQLERPGVKPKVELFKLEPPTRPSPA